MIQIDACKNGDKEALGELYTTYADRLLGVCRHYVKDDDSARDVRVSPKTQLQVYPLKHTIS